MLCLYIIRVPLFFNNNHSKLSDVCWPSLGWENLIAISNLDVQLWISWRYPLLGRFVQKVISCSSDSKAMPRNAVSVTALRWSRIKYKTGMSVVNLIWMPSANYQTRYTLRVCSLLSKDPVVILDKNHNIVLFKMESQKYWKNYW